MQPDQRTAGSRAAFSIPRLGINDPSIFNVSPEHRLYNYDNDSEYGKGWRQPVTMYFFTEVVRLLHEHVPMEAYFDHVVARLRDLDDAMRRTAAVGAYGRHEVIAEMSVAVVLATKK